MEKKYLKRLLQHVGFSSSQDENVKNKSAGVTKKIKMGGSLD